ncbi:beta-galactosidase [Leeuwenhoekiella aestuarii]|uniref:Beta-galactosidase n=1 Tax=Leeuwenhoekiella aestuarii TaxID=2249426 RepID=A0A4Q0NNP0_9FLAO|nr:beta-galactosidase [Leeuwenhoekiella aestuarii]RXG11679.1 beta-galactosidase [Leeuwenhoekiella aestuarii]RXG12734.1 beta-galactosidase [Leeuwenhoekiella aestuarii]
MFKNRIVFILILLFFNGLSAQTDAAFKIENGSFVYKGKSTPIYSGEMHYERIPKAYWRHRIQMMKAMGLNTIATYVFWNYHNTAPGVWDFKTGNKNITKFIKIAQEEGMFVILRPGPYACGEWEFGGYPWFLQNIEGLKVRENNEAFLEACREYINRLAEEVVSLQVNNGGNIIMTQVENEFGSYVAQREDISAEEHKIYKNKIYKMLKEAGFQAPFFTSDGTWLFEGGSLEGVLPTANGEGNVANLKKAVDAYHNNEGPYMVAEFYPGWLDHWAEPFVKISAADIAKQTKVYLENDINFNLYMAHGGTNFGFTSGANYNDEHDIQPDITSYDYDAPISEAGWATPKYDSIRALMQHYAPYDIPDVPEQIPVIEIPKISLSKTSDALSYIKKQNPVTSDSPLTFEELEQGYGYVLYKKRFTQPITGTLKVPGLRDFATVYVNGKKVGELNRVFNTYEMPIKIPFNGSLEILVENMGRINYGSEIVNNLKGIIKPVTINDYEITGGWEMYKAPFTKAPQDLKSATVKTGRPVIYSGNFELDNLGDTFLDVCNLGKGIVFVNGHNLGRYWKVGPQQTLYVPGCWLKENNKIVVFEQLNEKQVMEISGVKKPVLEDLKL